MAQILVVDDEIGIRELLSEILADEGHQVMLAESAGDARRLRERGRPDLVLLDIWMPDTDGITLLKEWAASGQLTMPVVMMSGHATIETAVEATRIGALDFLEKPVALQRHRLFQEVERADAGGLDRGLDGGMARHHHHRHGELAARRPLLQQRDAVGVGHPDVEQHEIGPAALAQAARVACAFGEHDLMALVGQDFRQQLADAYLVVDYQYLCHVYAAFASGSSTLTDAPRVGRFSIATLP